MANSVKGETPLKLGDGREFVLVFGTTAIAAAEGVSGKPLPELGKRAAEGFFGALAAIFYGMLQLKHPGVSFEDAGDILMNFPDEVKEALDLASERGQPENAGGGKQGSRPRLKRSGSSGVK